MFVVFFSICNLICDLCCALKFHTLILSFFIVFYILQLKFNKIKYDPLLSLFCICSFIVIVFTSISPAYSQDFSLNNTNIPFSFETFLEFLKSPQSLLERFSIDFSRNVSTIDLLSFALGIVMYAVFIWNFYRLIARREIVTLHLSRYDSDKRKVSALVMYIIKYVIVFPLVITAWFFVYSVFMFFLAPDIPQDFVFLVVISLVIAIRIAAYYKEDLARDLAKMIPFALLGIFLVNTSIFTLDQFYDRFDVFLPFLGKILTFIVFAICVEAVLRVLFLIKRKIIPSVDTNLEENIERIIDLKLDYKINKLEDDQKTIEQKLEKQIDTTKDELMHKLDEKLDKHVETKDQQSKKDEEL